MRKPVRRLIDKITAADKERKTEAARKSQEAYDERQRRFIEKYQTRPLREAGNGTQD